MTRVTRELRPMASVTDAVKKAIAREFGSVQVDERHDFNTKDTILDFTSEGRLFKVEVTHEYDADYASGQVKLDLKKLGMLLRSSKSEEDKAVVMTSGITLKSAA